MGRRVRPQVSGPDFAGAERRRWNERAAAITWIYTDHPRRTAGGAALLVVAAIAWFALRELKPLRRVA